MRIHIGFLLFCLVVLMLLPMHLEARYFARWYTTMGNFTAELRDDLAPITANNFINLANDNFYDGLIFHRVIDNFMIQDGDPLGNGYGGPGYTIADEFNVGLTHNTPGMLAMANTGQPHSGGSQYYITVAPYPSGNGHYSIFGKIIQGMDIVINISDVPTDANDRPITPVYIDSLRILGLVINSVSPTDSVTTFDIENPTPFAVEAYDLGINVNPSFQWFIDDVDQFNNDLVFNPIFPVAGQYIIKCIASDADVSFTYRWHVTVSGVGNHDPVIPNQNLFVSRNYPNPFHSWTSVSYQLKTNEPVRISVYDIRGRLISQESISTFNQGTNQWVWNAKAKDGSALASGIYLFEFKTAQESRKLKGILVR